MDTQFTETFLNNLVFNNKLPDSWDFSYKITYGDVVKLFDFLDKENLSISSILSPFNLMCKSDMGALIKKPSNFKRKVLKLVKENQMNRDNKSAS